MKTCRTCHQEKALSEYHKRTDSPDGYRAECMECRCAAVRQWNSATRERRHQVSAAYKRAHVEELREKDRLRHVREPEKGKARSKAWRQANYEQWRQNAATWAKEHPDQAAATRRAYAQSHADEARARVKAWSKANPQRVTANQIAWRQANPDKVQANTLRQNARRRKRMAAGESVSVNMLIARDGLRCGLCGVQIDPSVRWPDPWSTSVDHVLPLALGGLHVAQNLRLTHLRCNVRRGARVSL